MGEGKVAIIILMVVITWIGIVTGRWKSQGISTMEDRNGVAFTFAVVIQTRNATSRKVVVDVRGVLRFYSKNIEKCKPL